MNEKLPRKFELPRDMAADAEYATLDDEEKQAILKRAREKVEEERKQKLSDQLMEAALRYERRRYLPHEQLVDILIDLPGHAPRLLIDGVEYSHSFTYRVSVNQARSMWELMQRCWNHEHEIGGANRNFYRRPHNLSIGPQHTNVPANRLLGL